MEIIVDKYSKSMRWERSCVEKLKDRVRWGQWTIAQIGSNKFFTLNGVSYRYFDHPYNRTWKNERRVEIPVAVAGLNRHKSKRVLEVGNVLSHYIPITHEVVDKYEAAAGVQAVDILDLRPSRPYDFIVSISTVEHIGWDESPRDPEKVRRAIDHLKTLLAPGGELFVTFPVGYHRYLDEYLQGPENPFQEIKYLKRRTLAGNWSEANASEAWTSRYGEPFPMGNASVFARYRQLA